ncbi:hypothetical protein JXQ70_20380 [bacterium]|nr:hypothetical protein [bacterium]
MPLLKMNDLVYFANVYCRYNPEFRIKSAQDLCRGLIAIKEKEMERLQRGYIPRDLL